MKRLLAAILVATTASLLTTTAAEQAVEGPFSPFLRKAPLHMSQVFETERFPNVVVTLKGTVLATFGNKNVRARRSEDAGETWGPEITIASPVFTVAALPWMKRPATFWRLSKTLIRPLR
ncbi:MAG: hypothetical protein ACI91J_001515 [Yoonia sp.]|jgi:hypothetical protein